MQVRHQATEQYADYYDRWASYYNSAPEAAVIEDYTPLTTASTVAEVNCGTGRLASLLAESTTDYLAFDVDPRLVKRANEKHYSHDTPIQFGVAIPPRIPLRDDTVDLLIDSWGFDTVNGYATAQEYERLLADDGTLAVVEEAWGVSPEDRNQSDYASLLHHVHPGHDIYDNNSRALQPLIERFGEPEIEASIETTYTFPSRKHAVGAFEFHVTGEPEASLDGETRSMLAMLLDGFRGDGDEIVLSEQATLYCFTHVE